ncbi:hypothetical protein Z517_07921 [Fonsecaea pedrosoi CBS 271.37]|uniref:Methyltransferase n=1 Tax=Fonsecaea pedrosoi CBS 271.37 TaxID=1442368 RepID=A0A0D2GBT0_9EURO|nr:uncharacterized protein Z517_07921 [Fonsecaea pedrosoi CBS 271.37]KIW78088.1 hypothetical protein Z517_07921 [Fonsecaea pedrosoi CBS 271.37]
MDISDPSTRLPKVQGATITYLAPLELYKNQKPYFSQLPCGTPLARTNLVESDHLVDIRDISGREDIFELDETGFQFMHLPTNISDWMDESVQSEYLPAISAWLKEYFKCQKVFIYNYNLRTNDTTKSGDGTWRSPIFRVHCDNTPESCAKRLEFQFPAEAAAIRSGRYRYVDIWRCVAGANVDAPLAVCDYRSITPGDLHRIDIVYPHFSEEGFEVTYNPAHRWYCKKGMSKDDIVLFKIDDNLEGVARFAPHTAFIDPSVSGNTKRASIEVRAIICG